jgi:hypothetical protein
MLTTMRPMKFLDIGDGKILEALEEALTRTAEIAIKKVEPWSFTLKVSIIPDKEAEGAIRIDHAISIKNPDVKGCGTAVLMDGKLMTALPEQIIQTKMELLAK